MADSLRALRDFVEARADGRCEYCRRYQEIFGETFFEIDHVIPRSKGGLPLPRTSRLPAGAATC